MRVATILAASLLSMLVGRPAVAAPSAPRTEAGHFEFEFRYVDEGATEACGFDVVFDQMDRGEYEVFYDANGDPTGANVHTSTDGTVTANGITLLEHGRENSFLDLLSGTSADASLEFRVWLPGLGVVIMDRGRLLFDADGNPVFVAGPHPALDGDFSKLCAALTP